MYKKKKCRDPGSNRGPLDLQSNALPTELSRPLCNDWGQEEPVQKGKGSKLEEKGWGPTEIWTRIAGFRVQSANHYTMGPGCFHAARIMRTSLFLYCPEKYQKMLWGSSGIWTRDLSHPKRESYP